MERWSRLKYLPGISLGEDGNRLTSCENHIAFSKRAATEGMVLLKNEGILPLKKGCCVSIFGKAQFDYVKVGGGSGDVCCKYVRNIYEGFKVKESENKVNIFHTLSKFYEEKLKCELSDTTVKIPPGMVSEPEITDEMVEQASVNSDVAIINLSVFI